jgi:hypothetical protein
MAIPTISAITPNTGPVGGYAFTIITGTNFNLVTPQADTGLVVIFPPTISVTVNGSPALEIEQISATELWILTPQLLGQPVEDPIPAIDIVITNLDIHGNPIGGETVTATGGYTYRRPVIHSTSGNATARPHPFTLITSALVLALRREVFINVVQTTHVDYAEPDVMSLAIAKVPSLVVQGPNITKDLDYTHNEQDEITIDANTTNIKQPPDVLRMGYTFICVTDNEAELLNIMGSFQLFFMKGKWLNVNVDPLDLSQGSVNLVMQLTQFPQATTTPSDNNLRVWVAAADIRGVEVHLDEYAGQVYTTESLGLEVQQFVGETIEV